VNRHAEHLAADLDLTPLPAEGGRFRRTWAGPADAHRRPAGSAILVLLTDDPGDFCTLHRLPVDEVWHHYRGDALDLLLLHPDGRGELRSLGAGHLVQTVVPAGSWMGARVAPGGSWALFGTTMAPGFTEADWEGGEVEDLVRGYPEQEPLIRALCRPGAPARMPEIHDGAHRAAPGVMTGARTLPDLSGTVALVTGASGVIGAGIAACFAEAGAAVAVHHRRNRDAAEAVADQIRATGGQATTLGADLTDPDQCCELIDRATAWHGRLDTLVNNAGVQPVQPLAETTAAEWRHVMDANLTSAVSCTRAAATKMAEGEGGSVIHIASIEGTHPAAGHAHYSASKAGLIMFARSAALEYGPAGIRVNTVSPGLIHRPGLEHDWPEGVARWHSAAPLRRLGSPQDVGAACVFLASPGAAFITGHDLVVDGGVTARPTW
jgi:NAD(P)-dependent dehydrogenase (short-subunit alcohol dehydrogenase family)/predicted cupin superfamily sugar epimerase